MNSGSALNDLKTRLDELAATHPRCGGVFCSTCGGYAGIIPKLLTTEDRELVETSLSELTIDRLTEISPWQELLPVIARSSTTRMLLRSLEECDTSDIRATDRTLYLANKFSYGDLQLSEYTHKFATKLIPLALATKDYSLTETLILVLDQIPQKLLNNALEAAKDNQQMARVLYNKLRDSNEQVRHIYESYNQ